MFVAGVGSVVTEKVKSPVTADHDPAEYDFADPLTYGPVELRFQEVPLEASGSKTIQ